MFKALVARFKGSAAAKPKQTVLPPEKNGVVDDTLLRALAADYESGFCKWMLAGDMAELFKKLDAYNATRPLEERISIEMHGYAPVWIQGLRDKGMHDYAQTMTMGPKDGPLVLEGDMVVRVMGPQAFGGIRLRMGNEVREAEYSANPVNTCLQVNVRPGEWREIQFGLDTPDLFARAQTQLGSPPAMIPSSA